MVSKLVVVAIIALLWRLGGWNKAKWSGYRDVLIPLILALWYAFALKWWLFFVVGGLSNIIRMGYGAPDATDPGSWLGWIFKKDWLIRGMYGLNCAFVIALPLVIYTGKWLILPIYIGLNFAIGATLCRLKATDWIIEPAVGAGIGSIIFLV